MCVQAWKQACIQAKYVNRWASAWKCNNLLAAVKGLAHTKIRQLDLFQVIVHEDVPCRQVSVNDRVLLGTDGRIAVRHPEGKLYSQPQPTQGGSVAR